jgi:hypothetical protein
MMNTIVSRQWAAPPVTGVTTSGDSCHGVT